MSMIACFRRLPGSDAERLIAKPSLIHDYIDEDEEHAGFGPYADLDLDKSWHGIHFLLTGTAWDGSPPLDFTMKGGEEVGDEDVGYGPARAIRPAEVKVIAGALAALDRAELGSRFDPKAMDAAEIYPTIWERDGEEALEYLLANFDDLKPFFAAAADNGEAVLAWVT